MDQLNDFLKTIIWPGETKIEHLEYNQQCYVWKEKRKEQRMKSKKYDPAIKAWRRAYHFRGFVSAQQESTNSAELLDKGEH